MFYAILYDYDAFYFFMRMKLNNTLVSRQMAKSFNGQYYSRAEKEQGQHLNACGPFVFSRVREILTIFFPEEGGYYETLEHRCVNIETKPNFGF